MTIETKYFRRRDTHTDFRVVIVRWRRRPWRSTPARMASLPPHLLLAALVFGPRGVRHA